jgi:hypothetical protein
VEKGTFSGYWVNLDIGRNIKLRCGVEGESEAIAKSLKKGAPFTRKGKVGSSWTAVFGVMFTMEGGM